MENYNDKELDRWLRDNAGSREAPPAADGWDSPSKGVWTGLRAGLDQRKKRRRWLLLLGLGLILALGGSGLAYWFKTNYTAAQTAHTTVAPSIPQQAEINITEASQNSKQAEGKPTNTHPTVNTNTPLPAGKNVSNRPAGDQFKSPGNIAPEKLHNTGMSQIGSNPRPTSQDGAGQLERVQPRVLEVNLASTVIAQNLTKTMNPDESDSEESAAHEFIPVSPFAALQILPPPALNWQRKPQLPTAPIEPHQSSQVQWYAGAVGGLFFSTRRLKNAHGQTPNGQESGAWSWQQGLQAGFKLNPHWAIETGLQRTSVRLHAERVVQFQYRTDQEQFNPDRFIYQNSSDQLVQTSFGEVEMRMDLNREPNRPITDHALLKLNIRTDEQVHYLRIPLLLRWNTATGPWQWSLAGGLGLSFEKGYELSMTAARSNRPGIRDISARAKRRANGLAPITLDAQLSAGVQYRIAPKWSIQLSPEFRYGLSSMYRNGPFQSLAVSGGLQLGMSYHFNK